MPYIRPFRGGYAVCSGPTIRGSFEVSDLTVAEWDHLCVQAGHNQPRDWAGRRLRPYPALNVASHAPFAPDGVYVDHRDPAVERTTYEMRDRLNRLANGERQAVLQAIADQHGLRHWRDAYNTVRNVGRRLTGESGRNQDGELVWRRWSSTFSRQATAIADANPGHRHFGIEIEFCHTGGNLASHRDAIGTESRRAGVTFTDRWGSYGRATNIAGWQGTYDSTVDGGEIISDILVGDDASHDEVRDMLRRVRLHGGTTRFDQGMHVHHDVRDFTVADRVRLVDNLQAAQDALLAYVGNRRNVSWCRPLTDSQWDVARHAASRGQAVNIGRYVAFNMGRMHDRGAIEFRSLGNTLNGRKVRTWIRVGQAFMAATKDGTTFRPGITVPELIVVLRRHGLTTWAARQFLTRTGHSVDAIDALMAA